METPETLPADDHTPLIQENDGLGGVWDGHEKGGSGEGTGEAAGVSGRTDGTTGVTGIVGQTGKLT